MELEDTNFQENSKIKISNNKSTKNLKKNLTDGEINLIKEKLIKEKNTNLLDRSNLFANNIARDYQLYSITERFSMENKEKNETQIKILNNETSIKEFERKNKILNSDTKGT